MIHLHSIEKAFGPRTLFQDVDWHIKRNERVGLIGPNGVGKTTLMKIVVGELQADAGEIIKSKDITLGYLPQEITVLRGRTVYAEAEQGLEEVLVLKKRLSELEAEMSRATPEETPPLMERWSHLHERFEALEGFRAQSRTEEILQGLGFKSSDFYRDCGELSGGWQMRVVLARLLLQQPDLLLLDEPTNHLDLETLVWLENFLKGFRGSLVFISHDRMFLDRLATDIAELTRSGLETYHGNFEQYLVQQSERRLLAERQAKNRDRRAAELERFIERFRYKATKARQAQSRVKMLEKLGDAPELAREEKTIHFSLPEPPKSGRVVLELADITQSYGERTIYQGLDLQILRGLHVALVGPNGAGKSTLLKLLAGVLPYSHGELIVGHQVKLYYFAQHQVDQLDLKSTVLAEVDAEAGDLTPTRVRDLLGAFLFKSDDLSKKVEVLSGGEKNRLALIKMLLARANVLLLDEPTNHLDMGSRSVLEAALADYSGTIVLISHDRHFIDGVCDEVWEVADGQITPFMGGYSEYEARVQAGDRPDPLPLRNQPKKPKPKPAPEPEPQVVSTTYKSKEDKRRQAEARQLLSRETKGLRQAIEQTETQIAKFEEELEALRAEQADPAHYSDPERVRTVAKEATRIEKELEDTYARWTELQAELEAKISESDLS